MATIKRFVVSSRETAQRFSLGVTAGGTLTPTLSRRERGLFEWAFISTSRGKIAISLPVENRMAFSTGRPPRRVDKAAPLSRLHGRSRPWAVPTGPGRIGGPPWP